MHPSRRKRFLLLAAALLLAAPGASQEEREPGGPLETPLPADLLQREEVRFVTLDVVAERRRSGRWRRVRGLTADRVEVFVGDREVEIELFESRCGGEGVAAAAGGGSPTEGTGAAPGVRRYVLYFDLQHLKAAGHHASFEAARHWAREVFRPGDEVMILTGDLGLRVIRGMRPASEDLEEDLDRAEREYREATRWADGEGNEHAGRIREILDLAEFEKGAAPVQASGLASSFAAAEVLDARRSLQNLEDLMAVFENIPGTKNLVIFQETIRMYPGRQYPLTDPLDTEKMEPFVIELARAANERNVRIYPVDAGGMEGEGDEALHMLATETGGRFYTRSNDLAPAVELIHEDDSCFYRIGFRVRPRFSGSVSRIRVQVDGRWETRKYRLRHRRTLADPTREERDADRIRAALLQPGGAGAFPVWISASALLEHPEGARVRLQLSAAFADLLMIPSAERRDTSRVLIQMGGAVVPLRAPEAGDPAEARNVLHDAATDRPPWQFARQALLELPHGNTGPAAGRFVALAREVDVPPGRYRFIGVIQDRLAGVLASGSTDFTVGPPPVVGEARLAVEDPRIYFLERKEDEERDPRPGRHPDRVAMAAPVLPEELFLRRTPSLRSTPGGSVVYGLCDPASSGASSFQGWELRRALTCNDRPVPQPGQPTSLHPAGITRSCATVIDPLPREALEPGLCRYSITAALPDGRSETRSLEFHVLDRAPPRPGS